MDKIFAGIDVSTQSLKIIILNLSNSSIIYKDTVFYDKDLPVYNTSNGVIKNVDLRVPNFCIHQIIGSSKHRI